MKSKFKKINFLLVIMLISCSVLFFYPNGIVNASENVPEVEVRVNYSGIKTTQEVGEIGRNEDVLTRISDVLLKGNEMFTYDSETSNKLNTVKPGDTVEGNMGCVLKDVNGEKITSLEIELQGFVNVSKEDVANELYNDYSFWQYFFTEKQFKDIITSQNDVISSGYGKYLTQKYYLTVEFGADGQFMIKVPEDMPENILLAITAIEDPITGEKVNISEIFRLFVALGNGISSSPDKVPNEDDGHRYFSIGTSYANYADMEPSISGKIYSDKYDVTKGIPTSENIMYQLSADNAIYDITTRTTKVDIGVKDITIILTATYPQKHTKITYDESGEKIEKTWTTTERVSRTLTTKYSYAMPTLTLYDVPISNVFPVQGGLIQTANNGNTLSSGTMGLTGGNVQNAQTIKVTVEKPNVKDVEYGNIGHYASKTAALNALNANTGEKVKNRIKIAVHAAAGYTGTVNYNYYGLSVTEKSYNGVKPNVPQTTGASTSLIPSNYPNGKYVSSASAVYAGGRSFSTSVNDIMVHTPVINNAYISSTSNFVNQKINIDPNRKYLMLDEQFTIYIPDNGTHNSYKGYGTRKYNTNQGVTGLKSTWGKIKDVRLPFDAYLHYVKNGITFKYFVKANTWLSECKASELVDLRNTSYTFTIPVWVTEQTYEIETRVIAENAVEESMYNAVEAEKNSSVENYVATKSIPVEIIGKIYDLRISSTNDVGWQNIYSQKNNTDYITPDEFPFGSEGQNKNTAYKYAPKLGYTFVFDFKTKGIKSNNIDVSLDPKGFYFISRDGTTKKEVDLYYDTVQNKNIKISAGDTNNLLVVNLRDSFMKVKAQELVDSTRIYKSKYNYSLSVKVGTFMKLNLPENLRLCYNNFAEYVNSLYGKGSTESSISANAGGKDEVIKSVGHWYAGYKLPATTKVVEKGADISTAIKNNTLLKDGYILVKLDIKTKYQNKTGNYEYLQFSGPEAIYDASLRSSNDAENGITH